MNTKRKWTEEEMRILRELYPHTRTEELCNILNRSASSVYGQANTHGIKKSQEFIDYLLSLEADRLRKFGTATRYKKGQVTWNKGKKGYIGANVTSFKKGQLPHNTKSNGDTRLDKEGYVLVKVAHKKWIRKHRLIWEEANGPIPKGFYLRIKDKNKENYNLDNMELVTMAENMRRNMVHRYPEELKKTIRALQKLKRTIKKHGKK
jgi:hypothetical protein